MLREGSGMILQEFIKIDEISRIFYLNVVNGAIRRFEVVIVRRRTKITREKLRREGINCQGIRKLIKVRGAIFI